MELNLRLKVCRHRNAPLAGDLVGQVRHSWAGDSRRHVKPNTIEQGTVLNLRESSTRMKQLRLEMCPKWLEFTG